VSPCPAERDVTATGYAPVAQRAAALIDGRDNSALATMVQQTTTLAERGRYESAARLRDQAAAAIDVLWRGQRLRALATVGELVAAAPDGADGWQLAVIRYGQLAAAGTARRGVPPMPVIDAIRTGAQAILPGQAPLGGALVEETRLVARWLTTPGVRIVHTDCDDQSGWASPVESAGPWADWAASARSARLASEQLSAQLTAGPPAALASYSMTEPNPSREEVFGRAGVDRLDDARKPGFPGRAPFGCAG
jgi:DNA polymerase-3 subunit epsilon